MITPTSSAGAVISGSGVTSGLKTGSGVGRGVGDGEAVGMAVMAAGEAEADRRAVLTPEGLERMLAALGNNLPLTLSEPVQVCEHNRYLNLPAGAQLLAAEQVTTLLQLRPALFPAVVAAMLNTYDDPVALLTLLLGCSEDTDLSAKDGPAVRDRLVRLWESGYGRPAVTI